MECANLGFVLPAFPVRREWRGVFVLGWLPARGSLLIAAGGPGVGRERIGPVASTRVER